jgi:hypothetical protein
MRHRCEEYCLHLTLDLRLLPLTDRGVVAHEDKKLIFALNVHALEIYCKIYWFCELRQDILLSCSKGMNQIHKPDFFLLLDILLVIETYFRKSDLLYLL